MTRVERYFEEGEYKAPKTKKSLKADLEEVIGLVEGKDLDAQTAVSAVFEMVAVYFDEPLGNLGE
ncbi:hypothetical protein [Campylobacter sp.]|uniref:hypothetical protein n=1 Tax=Campylobacter sp. TaxID=205 RepID=UPI002906A331|nr:hypothetical protein [Campylobacter sp.]MDU6827797.1 hypothetical protein [Campylobacter sp.]